MRKYSQYSIIKSMGAIYLKNIKYNKLVRDRIPEIIQKDKKQAKTEIVKGERLIELLNEKLDEELNEYKESRNVEELADLVEVIYGLLYHQGIEKEDFEDIRRRKAEKKGAFNDGIVLIEVIEGE